MSETGYRKPQKKSVGTQGGPNKILVVDDAPSVLALMQDILEVEYFVKTAPNGEKALEILKTYRPDLILLDITMTGIDGYEVCRKIRSDKTYGFTKIIMVSSRTMLEERLKGYAAGADDYISKPFKKEELLAKVRVFMRLKSVEDQLQQFNRMLNQQVRVRTEQLLEVEKMAALGRYAAGIVHNLNSPLQVIMGNAELLSMKQPDNQEIMALRKAAAQMKKIIRTILTTSRRESKEEYEYIDLNTILKEQIELLQSNLFFKHKIQKVLDLQKLPPYFGIYHHFSQIVGNLIQNAVDAMYYQDRKNRTISISSFQKEDAILIRISDTGHGISKEKIAKIFNPFFTTKPLTANDDRPTGTGLGLASCKEMVESYGGEILVRSVLDTGTTFTIKLPIDHK